MAANNQDSHYSPVVVAAISFWLALVIVIILVYVCASCRRTRRSNTSTSINNSTQLATSFRMNGLENSILESLPIFIYTKEADLEEGSLDCTVCLSEFAVGDKGRRLPCGHDFHLDCIDLWFASHSSCPICRTSVTCKDPCAESETECECDRLPQIGSNRAPQSFMLHLQDLPTSSGSESFKLEASPQIVRDLKRFLGSGRRMASLSNVQC